MEPTLSQSQREKSDHPPPHAETPLPKSHTLFLIVSLIYKQKETVSFTSQESPSFPPQSGARAGCLSPGPASYR